MISLKTQIFIALLLVTILTVMEAMYTNLNERLRDAWEVKFPREVFSTPVENLLRTSIVVIVLIRGVTIHIYLAAHLLIIIPLIYERLRFVLLIWLAVTGLRSVLVNLGSAALGLFVCSCLPGPPHLACFRYAGVKGLEIGCSVFMWAMVNRFLYRLGRNPPETQVIEQLTATTRGVLRWESELTLRLPEMLRRLDRAAGNSSSESDTSGASAETSLLSLLSGTLRAIDRQRHSGSDLTPHQRSERMATAAVYTFFEKAFGIRFIDDKPDDKDSFTKKFMEIHKDEIEKFIIKIENFINANRLRKKCIHQNCVYCQWEGKKSKKRGSRRVARPYYSTHYGGDYPCPGGQGVRGQTEEMRKWREMEDRFRRELFAQTMRTSVRPPEGIDDDTSSHEETSQKSEVQTTAVSCPVSGGMAGPSCRLKTPSSVVPLPPRQPPPVSRQPIIEYPPDSSSTDEDMGSGEAIRHQEKYADARRSKHSPNMKDSSAQTKLSRSLLRKIEKKEKEKLLMKGTTKSNKN